MKFTITLVFSIVFAFTYQEAYTQDCKQKTEDFKKTIEYYNVTYTPQKDYECLNEAFNKTFTPKKGQYANVNFGVYNQKTDITILMGFYLIGQGALYGSEKHVDSLANILPIHKYEANFSDTTINEKKFTISDLMLKKINASRANTFNVKIDNKPYKNKYGYVRAINIQRQDLGGFDLYFIAKDKSKTKAINKAIKDTWGIIRYRNDSLFKPDKLTSEMLVGKFRHLRPLLSKADSLAYEKKTKLTYSVYLSREAENSTAQKLYQKAIGYYLEILELNPVAEIPVYRQLSNIYLNINKPDSAYFYASSLMKKDSTDIDNQKAMADYYASMGEIEKGVRLFNTSLNKNTELDNKTFFYLGQFYYRNKMYEHALQKFKVLNEYFLANNKSTGLILFSIAQCYAELATQVEPEKNLKLAKENYLKANDSGYNVPKAILDKLDLIN